MGTSAYFKQEKVGKNVKINIGLGKKLDIFNENIISFDDVSVDNISIKVNNHGI